MEKQKKFEMKDDKKFLILSQNSFEPFPTLYEFSLINWKSKIYYLKINLKIYSTTSEVVAEHWYKKPGSLETQFHNILCLENERQQQ